MKSLPRVAVIGRPNVGKSTLFNRLVGRRVAIVDSTPGVTRDRLYGVVEWNGRAFGLIDTAGILSETVEKFDQEIQLQIEVAIEEADLLLFVVDALDGPTAEEEDLVRSVRRTGKPVVLAVNKIDTARKFPGTEFHRWGFDRLCPVSALQGTGTGDLLDIIIADLPESESRGEKIPEGALEIALIGRPNVGKSSLLNRLVGEERMVVSEVAGTTRDPVDSFFRYRGRELVLIDTAGLRKKMKTASGLDYYTLLRTISCIERCDVAVLLLDAREGASRQDMRIADMVVGNGKSLVLAMNKWDLIESKETNTAADIEKGIKADYPHLAHVPVVFISALTAQRMDRLLKLVVEVFDERQRRLPDEGLNEVLLEAVGRLNPPSAGGRKILISGCRQVGTSPPNFEIFTNFPDRIPEHYRRYLTNRIRDSFPFPGTPLRVSFTKRRAGGKKSPKSGKG
ncbi:MAG: ribosome biogenesis GTPase Der [Candidatus Glassbacteria bacterium GWA2_58_10]|uniref:GTPase Der n=1 Tax=Candidatus Glassbacteria bacterium GWA2_58_10 TaxID=1817865 RepID=A0A1F5YI22_9BACT|nr:MAG: ribosome biogenesis GTPase Der [Candidatus Glassbacteria bacterium GWA2_58_10]